MEKNQNEFFDRLLNVLSRHAAEEDVWIDGLQVQALLGITRKTVYRLIKDEVLKPKPIGRRNYFLRSAIFKLQKRFLK